MKKALIVLAALAAALSLTAPPPAAAVGICDPQRSALCSGLVDVWNFEEVTNSTRFGSYGNVPLYEGGGNAVAVASGKLGSYSASFAGSTYLKIPRYGTPTGSLTVAAWLYQTTQTGQQMIAGFSDGNGGVGGLSIYLDAGRPCVYTYEAETDTSSGYVGTTISANTWTLVVWKISPFGPYGKAQACVSVNGAAFGCGNLGYNIRGTAADLTVGSGVTFAGYIGRIDALGIWARTWSPADVALYYNSGSGRAFPFY